MDPCIEGLLSRNTNKIQVVTEFIIPKSIEGSTCFEEHTAHHQELYTVLAASGLYTHVVTGRCLGNGRSPHGYINQRLQVYLVLLMMSGVPLETC
jgi:hypothetical protein